MKRWVTPIVLAGLGISGAAAQQGKPVEAEHPAHQELRALKAKLLDAFNRRDLDALLAYVHPNVVVTWQNAEVSRGRDGVRAYYKKMLEGPQRRVDHVAAQADVDELTLLYGDRNGLAFGNLDQDFTLSDGEAFHLKSRWTAHVVKDNDQWLVSGLHLSSDVFDNGVLHLAVRRTALWTAVAAGVGGIVLGLILYAVIGGVRRRLAVGPTR